MSDQKLLACLFAITCAGIITLGTITVGTILFLTQNVCMP